ncbi:MAG: hypothetical protein ACYC3Q_10040 [Gemmatimonadaceae bacterium]
MSSINSARAADRRDRPSRRLRRLPAVLPLVGAGVVASCSGGATEPGAGVSRCRDGVTLAVSPRDTTVQLSWTPRCAAATLSVDGEGVRWIVLQVSQPLTGPVRYGETPQGAISIGLAFPLVSGASYRAILTSRVPGTLDADTVAVAEFRMSTRNANARSAIGTGLLFLGTAGASALWAAAAGTLGILTNVIAPLAVVGAGFLGTAAFRLPGWARLRGRQVEQVVSEALAIARDGR